MVDTEKMEAEVYGPVSSSTVFNNLVIPDNIIYSGTNVPVTSIRNNAFHSKKNLRGSLTIGNNVRTIGEDSFYRCSGFTGSLTIGDNVQTIGYGAFSDCSGFTGSLTIPNSVQTIGNYAFDSCKGFTDSLTIGDNVQTIGYGAFSDCSGFTGSLTIPNSVQTIGNYAFDGCSGLTSVTIPNSVTSIGGYVFYGCSGLTSVTIPNSVTSIGYHAFNGCISLTSIKIPNSVTSIGWAAFAGCSGLTSVTIPNSVTSIGESAFSGCSGLTNVTIPNSVTSIGDSAFSGCRGMTSVTIPNSVTSIGSYAFYGCRGMTSIEIPNSVTSIGEYAFNDCTSLCNVNLVDGENSISLGYNTYSSSTGKGLFADCPLETLHIGRNYTVKNYNSSCPSSSYPQRYGYSPFVNQANLTSVTIGDNVTSLPEYLLYKCSSLTSIEIPNSITSIGNYAFQGCSGIKELTIQDGDTSLSLGYNSSSSGQFGSCPLEKVYIGRNISYSSGSSYGYSSFANQKNLSSVVFGENITNIPPYLLYGCSSITEITIPNSVTSIGNFAFNGCTGLTSLKFEEGQIPITLGYNNYYASGTGKGLFADCALESLYLGRSIQYSEYSSSYPWNSYPSRYGYSAFANQTNLSTIVFGESVTKIPDYLLYGCSSITEISIPNSVTSIGAYGFYDCSGLTSVTIPNSITSIGNYAFQGCSGIKEVTIQDGDATLSLGYPNSTSGQFGSCPLEKIYIGRTLSYSSGSSYGYSPFANQKNLSSVVFGESVTNVPPYLLYGCSSLTEISIPNSVTTIENYAFYGCGGLTSLIIPNSVNEIGNSAFEGCTAIGDLTIQDSENVLKLGKNTNSKGLFSGCNLSDIYLGRNLEYQALPERGYSPFYGTTVENAAFGAFVDKINDYCFSNCENLSSVIIPQSISVIGKSAFSNCLNLASVVLPAQLEEIPENAFNGCSSLIEIDLPESLTILGEGSFMNCTKLDNITIPSSISCIGSKAFYGSNALKHLTLSPGDSSIEIGSLAFPATLESLSLGRNIISNGVFANQSLLSAITLSSSVVSLPESTFKNCTSLSEITLPAKLEEIGAQCFDGCSNLGSIYYTPAEKFVSFSSDTFNENTYRKTDLLINEPQKAIDATYDENWSGFFRIFHTANGTNYIPLTWNTPLTVNSIFSSDHGCLMPVNQDINLKSGSSSSVIFNGKEIYSELNSDNGFTYSPEDSWTLNKFHCYGGDLADKARVVELPAAEKLFDELGLQNIQNVEELTIIGDINGTDVMTLNRLSNLRYLNLTQAHIVEGGQTYRENLKTANNEIGSEFFYDANKLETLVLPESVTKISDKAFYGRSSLINVIIGSQTSSIGVSAFSGCSSLTSIKIPQSVTTIGNLAFSGCNVLSSVEFEDGTSQLNIGYNVYASSGTGKGLFADSPLQFLYLGRTINYSNYNSSYPFVDYPQRYGYSAFYGQAHLSKVEIGPKVKSLPQYLFASCTGVENITIPSGVSSIGSYAFNNCSSLLNVIIEEGDKTVGTYAFNNCSSLLNIIFEEGDKTIKAYTFNNCENLESVFIGEGETTIGNYAFNNCKRMVTLTLPEGLTTIGSYAFNACSALPSLTIPGSVLSIGNNAFAGCTSLKELEILDYPTDLIDTSTITYYPDWTSTNHANSSNSSYTYSIPVKKNDVLSFEAWVDSEGSYDYLTVTLSGSEIIKISGQNQVKTYSKTFNSNSTVSLVVKYSKDGSESKYSDTGGIRNITLNGDGGNDSSLSLGNYGSKSYFADCPLESLYIGRNLSYTGGSSYGYAPFYNQAKLQTAVVGPKVTQLQAYYFAGCKALSSVVMPETMKSIGDNAFQNCSSIRQIMVPDSIENLGDFVFDGCTSLSRLKLGVNLQSINNTAFRNCANINKIYSYALLPPVITTTVFEKVDKNLCELVVRKGRVVYYWNDPVWKDFFNLSDDILEMPTLPQLKYGDAPIDLSDYAPEGYSFNYESSNPEVAMIDGTMLSIVGAGEATVGILNDEEGVPMDIIGYMRQFIVDKADLNVSVNSIEIYEGDQMPELEISFDGLCYDDELADIEELPVATCEVTSESAPGEYPVVFTGGKSRNYNFVFADSKVIIKERRKISILPFENAVYGDEPIDLTQFTPEGESVVYSLEDDDAAEIANNVLTIKNAGTFTIYASLPEETTDAMIINPELTFTIEKSPLEISVRQTIWELGTPFPEFEYVAIGLKYDDTLDDIEELPAIFCDADGNSPLGEYEIRLEGGADRNYDITTMPSKLIITEDTASIESVVDRDRIHVFNYNGILIYEGPEVDLNMSELEKGAYIFVKGNTSRKVMIK